MKRKQQTECVHTFQRVDNSCAPGVRKRPHLDTWSDSRWRHHAAILDRRPPCCRHVVSGGCDVISERHTISGQTSASCRRYVGACHRHGFMGKR